MSKATDPDALRSSLLRAAGDAAALRALCRDNAAAIRQHFPSWLNVPDALKDRPDLLQIYAQTLAGVAAAFADDLGDPSLNRLLSGPPGDNPVEQWEAALKQAREGMASLRLDDAIRRLTDLAIDVGRLRGSAADAYLPVILGSLGECYFHSGQHDRALEPTRQALERVRRRGDVEGEVAYLGNLYEIHRYRGEREPAARYAEELAATHERRGDLDQARRYRNQATLVRAGEPPLRVVLDVGGRRYELEEVLGGVEGAVRFLFERDRLALGPSEALTRRGRGEAGKGRHAEALSLFDEAIGADPLNPQPVYESALTLTYLGRPSDAVERYDRTEELAPGWFHCRAEGWLARQVAAGRYPNEVFLTLHSLQDGPLEPAVKAGLAAQALRRFPDLAPMHLVYGKLLADPGQRDGAVAAFRRGLACAEEPDVRTRLLVDLASAVEDDDERRELCRQARELNGNLVASATAAVVLAFD